MNKLFTLFLLGISLIFIACGSNSGAADGEQVNNTTISPDDYQDFYYQIEAEDDLCGLVDKGVLTKHFPGAETFSTRGLGLSQFGLNNGGCAISWSPEENIGRTRAEGYFHLSPRASIEIKYNANPDTSRIDSFAQKSLNHKMNPEYKKGPDSLGLDSKYYKVNNVGSFAIWNNGTSSLEFAVGENMLFSISVKYPKPDEERKAIAKDIAQALIENVTRQ